MNESPPTPTENRMIPRQISDTTRDVFAPPTEGLDSGAATMPRPASSGDTEIRETDQLVVPPPALSLFDITRALHAIEIQIKDNGGDLSPELESAFSSAIIAKEKKIDAYAAIINRLEMLEEEEETEIAARTAVKNGYRSTRLKLRDGLKGAMEFLEVKEIQGDRTRFQLRTGKDVLKILAEEKIPRAYFRPVTKLELDKDALAADIRIAPKAFDGIARIEPTKSLYTLAAKKEPR